jgi:hypothetical protein
MLLRIPYLMMNLPIIQPEIIWLLMGERISDGHLMYTGILDDTGPFSSLVYWASHVLFGKSASAYRFLAFFVILFQVYYINHLFIRFKTFDENSYIPAFVMAVLFHISFDFLTLSPGLMGGTFILLAFGQLLGQTSINQNPTESVLLMGLYAGIGFCFHFPLVVFLPFLILSGIMINGFSFQQLALSVTGYLLPVSICALFFFWMDGLYEFLQHFFLTSRTVNKILHVQYTDLLFLFLLPCLLSLAGYLRNNFIGRMNLTQQKQNQLFVMYGIFLVGTVFLINRLSPYQFICFLPVFTYFVTHLIVSLPRPMLQSILFYSFFLIIPFMGYSWAFYKKNDPSFIQYAILPEEKHLLTSGLPILVLGNDLTYYHNASLATPYLHFGLVRNYWKNRDDLEVLTNTYLSFIEERPVYVIDEEGVFKNLMEQLPKLKNMYLEEKPGVYRLK